MSDQNKASDTTSIAIFSKAAVMLAEADTIQKAKELKSLALTAAEWAKRKNMGEEAIQHCRSYALEAERKMGQMLIEGKAAGEVAKQGRPKNLTAGKVIPTKCDDVGISWRESAEAQMLAELPQDEFDKIKSGEATKVQAKRKVKEARRERKRAENAVKVAAAKKPDDLDGLFTTIVIDPPWDWGDEGDVNQLGRARPDYATMPVSEIAKLPLGKLSDADAHIYCWVTNRSMPKVFGLLEAWGFRFVTILTWPKKHFGMGNYFRGQTEHVVFGVKGSLQLKRKNAGTLLPAWDNARKHSAKPGEFLEFVESCSPGPYLEMFSRSKRHGWVMWGE